MVDKCCSCAIELAKQGIQVLPHMNAFVCEKCADTRKTYSESEITNKAFPVWSEEQIKSASAYQRSDSFLPFVCTHKLPMRAKADGFVSVDCAERVGWAYPWILDWSWKDIEGPDYKATAIPKHPYPGSGESIEQLALPEANQQAES